jgi:LysM repeat protein
MAEAMLLAGAVAACTPLRSVLPQAPTAALDSWRTSTPRAVTATVPPTLAATPEAGPSPTPFKHVVEQNETLLQIAALYGVTLDALLAINPGLNPLVLSIGQELLIPGPEGEPIVSLIPTSTPIPLALQPAACYRRPSGGLWCLTAVRNPTTQGLENLLVEIGCRTHRRNHRVRAGIPAAELVAPWETHAAGSIPRDEWTDASAAILSVIPRQRCRGSLPQAELVRSSDTLQPGGRSWLVEGTIEAAGAIPTPNRTLILATALDDAGRVVGYAVWEADPELEAGETRPFALRVFSLGPSIARVEVQSEMYTLWMSPVSCVFGRLFAE